MKRFNSILMLLMAFALSITAQTTTLPKCDPGHKDITITIYEDETGTFSYAIDEAIPHNDAYTCQTTPYTLEQDIFKDYEPIPMPSQPSYKTAEYRSYVERPPLNYNDLTISNTAKPIFIKNEVIQPASKVPVVKTQNPQEVIDGIKNSKDWEGIISWHTPLFALITLFLGYISPFVPWLNKISSTYIRLLAFALIVIVAIIKFGFGNVWQGAAGFLISTGFLYQLLKASGAQTAKTTANATA